MSLCCEALYIDRPVRELLDSVFNMRPVDSSETMVPSYHSVVVYGTTTQYWALPSCPSGFETCDYKLRNEELNDLYSSPNIVRVIESKRLRWAGHVARMKEGRGVHKVLVGKPEGKRPLGRPRRRWEDNIKMDLQEVGRDCGE